VRCHTRLPTSGHAGSNDAARLSPNLRPAPFLLPSPPQGMLLLDVRANQLSGTIPTLPPALLDLNLASNSFTGQLPQLPPRLISLNASYNQLAGDVSSLPLAQMARLLMAGNQLTGSLTPELLAAPRLAALDLAGNQLSGSLPSNLTLPLLQRLSLANNKLTGGQSSRPHHHVHSVAQTVPRPVSGAQPPLP
jgi:hypothetical protein